MKNKILTINIYKNNRFLFRGNYMKLMRIGFLVILTGVFIFSFAGCKKKDNSAYPKEIVICYLPNSATEEYAESRGMIQNDLSKAIGIKVTEINVADYNAVVEAMRTKRADIANFGPTSYVQAVTRSGAEALVVAAPHGDKILSGYTTKIVVKAGSPINSIRDLRGKTFAFVDPSSTSGNYVPALEFLNAFPGITSEDLYTNGKFFSSVMFSGRHQNGVMSVINGDVDAAPIASSILDTEIAAGRIREGDIKVIHESQLIPGAPVAIRGDLPEDLKKKIKDFYLSYKNLDYFEQFSGYKPEEEPCFIEALDSDYDYVRELMAKVMP
jgi:phosphonate transport system substrate-binding protein